VTTTGTWPPIPSWEMTDLEQLGQANQLSGLNPIILGVIDDAESSGEGGGINSSGYGGFFGLGAGSNYPGGTATAPMLSDPGSTSFEEQAVIAASAFNSYLQQAGGNPVNAEEIYQSGSASGPTEGSQLMAQYLGGAAAGGGGAPGTVGTGAAATLTGFNLNPFDLFGIPQTAASSLWSLVGPFLVKAILVLFGMGIMLIGFKGLAGSKMPTMQSIPPAAVAAAAA